MAILLATTVGALCGLGVWAYSRQAIVKLQADLGASQTSLTQKSDALQVVTQEYEDLESRYQGEALLRARLEPEAERSRKFEKDLTEQAERIEDLAAQKSGFEKEAARIVGLEATINSLRDELRRLDADKVRLEGDLKNQTEKHSEQVAALTAIREDIDKNLKVIASESLRANQENFLTLANANFEKHKMDADAELESRKKAVEGLVAPLQQSLEVYQAQIKGIEAIRLETQGALSAELKNVIETQNAVRRETAKLSNALRAAPKTRGRWGEHTLRNVLELSGLSAYCDYTVEEQFERDGGQLRPDVVIRLPGDRAIVIDAKTSLSAYLDATEATEESDRDRFLDLHVAQLRSHVKQLAGKAYWDGLTVTPDFVVMFVPGDNFYSAAAERDPALFEEAVVQQVIIVTPATLIALAKAVAFGWRQEKVAENAQKVHNLGKELYKRVSTMAAHIENCGAALGKSVEHFNKFVGSLENSVLVQARRFNELQVEGTSSELDVIGEIDLVPRELRRLPKGADKESALSAEGVSAAVP